AQGREAPGGPCCAPGSLSSADAKGRAARAGRMRAEQRTRCYADATRSFPDPVGASITGPGSAVTRRLAFHVARLAQVLREHPVIVLDELLVRWRHRTVSLGERVSQDHLLDLRLKRRDHRGQALAVNGRWHKIAGVILEQLTVSAPSAGMACAGRIGETIG